MRKILIVDDEKDFTRLVKLNLEAAGDFAVATQNEAKKALSTALDFKPDLIFLDIIMPQMDGTEVASQLLKEDALDGVPIIFLTAIFSPDEAKKFEGILTGHSFLIKPVTVDQLIAAIEDHLGK